MQKNLETKRQFWAQKDSHPERIMENQKIIVGSKKVANVFNRFYVSKIRKLREKMSQNKVDPMIHFKKFIKKPKTKLELQPISMDQLDKIYSKIRNKF